MGRTAKTHAGISEEYAGMPGTVSFSVPAAYAQYLKTLSEAANFSNLSDMIRFIVASELPSPDTRENEAEHMLEQAQQLFQKRMGNLSVPKTTPKSVQTRVSNAVARQTVEADSYTTMFPDADFKAFDPANPALSVHCWNEGRKVFLRLAGDLENLEPVGEIVNSWNYNDIKGADREFRVTQAKGMWHIHKETFEQMPIERDDWIEAVSDLLEAYTSGRIVPGEIQRDNNKRRIKVV